MTRKRSVTGSGRGGPGARDTLDAGSACSHGAGNGRQGHSGEVPTSGAPVDHQAGERFRQGEPPWQSPPRPPAPPEEPVDQARVEALVARLRMESPAVLAAALAELAAER